MQDIAACRSRALTGKAGERKFKHKWLLILENKHQALGIGTVPQMYSQVRTFRILDS